jgi:hypothetical protein
MESTQGSAIAFSQQAPYVVTLRNCTFADNHAVRTITNELHGMVLTDSSGSVLVALATPNLALLGADGKESSCCLLRKSSLVIITL